MDKKNENRLIPLVSIVVITYNSSKYVLETLDSIKEQTYENIELIISDDYSLDDTVIICEKWIKENKDRFVRTKLITVKKNTGIPSNCNRGVNISNGEWIKLIAGDDLLFDKCIADNIEFINQTDNCYIVHSDFISFEGTFDINNFKKNQKEWRNLSFLDNKISQKKQNDLLHYICSISAPTVIINKSAILNVNGFDEDIFLMEDMPMWLRLSNAGYKFHHMPKTTIGYRNHAESVSGHNKNFLFNVKYTRCIEQMHNKYTKKNYSVIGRFYLIMFYKVQYVMDATGLNNKNNFSIILYELFRRLAKRYKTKQIEKILGIKK